MTRDANVNNVNEAALPNVVVERGRLVPSAPAVSIIVPSYNTAAFIAEALDSVLAQTFDNYECVVVNDGSPDTEELERVLAPYRERIVYVRQENRGLSGARNTALRVSTAPLVALLDSDDAWEPRYLEVQVGMMGQDPTLAVLYPNARIFGDAPDAGREYMDICPSEGEVTFESLLTQRCNVFICATARRDVVERAGAFDEEAGNQISEDFDLWLRIVNRGGRVAYHREVLARYRRRRGNISSDPVWVLGRILRALDKAAAMRLTTSEREVLRRERARFEAELRLNEGKRAFFAGETDAAIEKLSEANGFFKSRRTALVLLLLRRAPRLLQLVYGARDRFILRADTKF